MIKTIPLTDDHRDKLIRMANRYFPEGRVVLFSDQQGLNYFLAKDEDKQFVLILNQHGFPLYPLIHWVEFCFFHLADKMFSDEPDRINYLFWETIAYCYTNDTGVAIDKEVLHPVDVLYEQFQKYALVST